MCSWVLEHIDMDRRSILAFIAIYSFVVGIGFFATAETRVETTITTEDTMSETASVNHRVDQE